MREQTKTKVRGYVAAIVVLAVLAGVLAIGYFFSSAAVSNYSVQLENGYQRSVYELVSDVNNIENNLSKATISTGNESRQKLFNNIYTDCQRASEDLSRLPISHESVNKTTNFINQTGGFCFYAEKKLKNGESLSTEDEQSITDLNNLSVYIQSILNDFSSSYNGKYSVLANTKNISDNTNSFNTMFSSMQAEGVEYPTLIYDGPFSESQVKKEIKGLSQNIASKEQAESEIKELYKNTSNFKYEGETTGLFETYNFSFKTESGRDIYIQVAKRDCFVLTISSYAASDKDKLDLNTCEQKAKEFAQSLGLEMEAVWSTKINGMAYVNLTPVINGVIIYPDMIKVKVSANSGDVLGYEAQSYAYNHTQRDDLSATVSENSARSKVNNNLQIESQKLALIPKEYGKEISQVVASPRNRTAVCRSGSGGLFHRFCPSRLLGILLGPRSSAGRRPLLLAGCPLAEVRRGDVPRSDGLPVLSCHRRGYGILVKGDVRTGRYRG